VQPSWARIKTSTRSDLRSASTIDARPRSAATCRSREPSSSTRGALTSNNVSAKRASKNSSSFVSIALRAFARIVSGDCLSAGLEPPEAFNSARAGVARVGADGWTDGLATRGGRGRGRLDGVDEKRFRMRAVNPGCGRTSPSMTRESTVRYVSAGEGGRYGGGSSSSSPLAGSSLAVSACLSFGPIALV
jgi:hypothetical protein